MVVNQVLPMGRNTDFLEVGTNPAGVRGGNGTRDHRRPNHLATLPQLVARAYFSKQIDELTSQ